MSKKLKKSAAASCTKLVATESTVVTSKLLDDPGEFMSCGPFFGTAVIKLSFDVKVSTSISVPAALYEYVKLQGDQHTKCLAPHDYSDPERLLGADFWSELSDAEKDMAKACVSHLCQSGALPLWPTDFGLKYPEIYCLDIEKKSKQAKAAA